MTHTMASALLLVATLLVAGCGFSPTDVDLRPTIPTSPPVIAAPLPTAPEIPPTHPPPPRASATPDPVADTGRPTSVAAPTGELAMATLDGGDLTPWTPKATSWSPATEAPVTPAPRATPLPPLAEGAPEIIIDDRDAGFSTLGAWYEGDGGSSYNGGCHWSPPGINIAYIKPDLPMAGAYDVFAWGCGDPNHDQAWLTEVMIYPFRSGFYAPPTTYVNLKDDAGRWVPIGAYYMQPGGSLSIQTPYYGNTAVDAFRFVYRSPDQITLTPEVVPTTVFWTNHPPAPQEQLTSGDLSARLGLVQRGYQYTPTFAWEEVTLDDCAAFPRNDCGGGREAWQTRVEYRGREFFSVPYRVSKDLRYVSLDPPEQLIGRQLLYLAGQNLNRIFYVYRYPPVEPDDGTGSWSWQVVSTDRASGSGSAGGVTPEQDVILNRLIEEYASIGTGAERVMTADGWELQLYGLGRKVALAPADRANLEKLGSQLGAQVLP